MVVTGDTTQVDVQGGRSGLEAGWSRCSPGSDGLGFVHLSQADVVRHRIVADIVNYGQRRRRTWGLTA
ncbi:MAG: PhoH family protein [Ilumatobacteraceae bacterium]